MEYDARHVVYGSSRVIFCQVAAAAAAVREVFFWGSLTPPPPARAQRPNRLVDEAHKALEPYGEKAQPLLAIADYIIERQN